jgi:hypothetical protein
MATETKKDPDPRKPPPPSRGELPGGSTKPPKAAPSFSGEEDAGQTE